MAESNFRVPFGRSAAGEIVTPTQVSRGLACNCTCPGCGGALVANHGEKKAWHFSHAANCDCKSGYESAIHAAMKQLLMRKKRIMLPPLIVWAYPPELIKAEFSHSRIFDDLELFAGAREFEHYMQHRIGQASSEAMLIEFDEVIEEVSEGDIRPDIIGIKGSRRLYIEVAASHLVDQEKERKVRDRGLAMIEIRMPYEKGIAPDFDMLERLLLETTRPEAKYWITCPSIEGLARQDHQKREVRYQQQKKCDEQARAARHERYERLYKPSHRLMMESKNCGQSVTVELSLCPSFVSLRMFGGQNILVSQALRETALAYRGRFDRTEDPFFRKWKIQPANFDTFVAVARSLQQHAVTRIRQDGSFMPEEDMRWLMLQLS